MHINHTLILASLAIGSFALAVPYDGSTSTALAKRQAEQNNNGPDEADTPPENPLDPAEQEDQADLSPQANDPSDPTYQGPDGIEPEQTRNINTNADSQNGGDADEDDDDDDDNMDEETRLAQEAQETWDNIPTLPPNLLEAVDWQTRVEVLAMARAFAEMGNIQKLRDPAFGLMRMRKPFLSRGRTRLIVDNTINQVRQVDRSGESIDDFGLPLLTFVVEADDQLLDRIKPVLQNWDATRVALIDMILIKMAMGEFLQFPKIAPEVTMNEYVDISKTYSTDKSREFVNGVLDNLHKALAKEGLV